MSWLKKRAKRLTTIKGIIKYTVPGGGVLQRSKSARKIALISGAVVGAYFAAPYLATAGKAALGYAGKGGAFAGQLLKQKLSSFAGNSNAARGVSDTAPASDLPSPTEDAFYGDSPQIQNPNSAAGRLPYGAAGSAGLAASSCSGPAGANVQSTIDFIATNLSVFDMTYLAGSVIIFVALFGSSWITYYKIKKA